MDTSFGAMTGKSGIMQFSLIGLAFGVFMIAWALIADNTVTPRANLETISGTLTSATKMTTRRKGIETVKFELTIVALDKRLRKLTVPATEIRETQVRNMISRSVTAEFDGESDVYAMTSNGQPVMTYEGTVKTRHGANVLWLQIGAAVCGIAGLLVALGYFLARRKTLKMANEGAVAQSTG